MWAPCPSFSPWLPLLSAPSPSFARTCGYAAALRFACERRSYQKERATAKSRLVGSPRKNVYHRKKVLSHRNCVTVIQRLLFQSGADPPCCSGSEPRGPRQTEQTYGKKLLPFRRRRAHTCIPHREKRSTSRVAPFFTPAHEESPRRVHTLHRANKGY
jgi:hypothetical protein